MRQFAYSLNPSDKDKLLNILKYRNGSVHTDSTFIHFDHQAIVFLQGLIDGCNRKIYNHSANKIDPKIENLRTENLRKMGHMAGNLNNRYRILDQRQLEQIRSRLNNYVSQEKSARGLEQVKQAYFDFINYYNSISNSNEVRSAVAKKKQANIQRNRQIYGQNLAKYRSAALAELEDTYGKILSSISIFHIGIRRKLKDIYIHKKNAILYAKDLDTLDDLADSIEDDFADICDGVND